MIVLINQHVGYVHYFHVCDNKQQVTYDTENDVKLKNM